MKNRTGLQIKIGAVLAMACWALASTSAQATAVNCPGTSFSLWDTGSWDREISITTPSAAQCTNYGNGSFNETSYTSNGWTTIDRTGDSGGSQNGALSVSGLNDNHGSFNISSSVWSSYSSVLFVLQLVNSTVPDVFGLPISNFTNPDWAAFTLASGTTTGTWSVEGLSLLDFLPIDILKSVDDLKKVSIYGRNDSVSVPEPAMLTLLAAALLGLALARRRIRV